MGLTQECMGLVERKHPNARRKMLLENQLSANPRSPKYGKRVICDLPVELVTFILITIFCWPLLPVFDISVFVSHDEDERHFMLHILSFPHKDKLEITIHYLRRSVGYRSTTPESSLAQPH